MDELAEFFVVEHMEVDSTRTFFLEKRTSAQTVGMKASTSKTASSSATRRPSQTPPPEEPSVPYVNNNIPNPEDEPTISDMRGLHSADEIDRQKSLAAHAKYQKARPEMIADQRQITAQLFHRYTEDEERKRIEQQKNKEAMSASAAPVSRNGHSNAENRKRRSETTSAEEDWNKRNQQQQHWMGQHPNGFQMTPHQYQQHQHHMMMQQQQYHMNAQQHHGMHMQQQHHQMPSTSSAESVRSIPTPASMHQPSPAEMRNGTNGMTRMGMQVSPPSSSAMEHPMDETNLSVPEGELFDQLAMAVAKQYNADAVLDPECFDALLSELDCPETTVKQSPNGMDTTPVQVPQPSQHQQEQNKMRLLQQQQQQQHQINQRMQEEQKQQILQQQRHHQMLMHQQQMQHHQQQQQQQQQMNGAQFPSASHQAAYMQQMRMHQMRAQQQQQQQQLQSQQQHQMAGYGMVNGYPSQMHHMHHAAAYGHHIPQHTPFANIN